MKYRPRTRSYAGQYRADTCPCGFAVQAGIGRYSRRMSEHEASISDILRRHNTAQRHLPQKHNTRLGHSSQKHNTRLQCTLIHNKHSFFLFLYYGGWLTDEPAKIAKPTIFQVVNAGYWEKFSTSNNHASVGPHWLWYYHCAKLIVASSVTHIYTKFTTRGRSSG